MEPYRNYSRNSYTRNNVSCDMPKRSVNTKCNTSCDVPNKSIASQYNTSCDNSSRNMAAQYMQPAVMDKMHTPLAMAYVRMQEWCSLYNPDEALCNGTAFPDLNLIFCGVRGKCHE